MIPLAYRDYPLSDFTWNLFVKLEVRCLDDVYFIYVLLDPEVAHIWHTLQFEHGIPKNGIWKVTFPLFSY